MWNNGCCLYFLSTIPLKPETELELNEHNIHNNNKELNINSENWKDYAVKIYKDVINNRSGILEDNLNKSGVYLWYNNITGLRSTWKIIET